MKKSEMVKQLFGKVLADSQTNVDPKAAETLVNRVVDEALKLGMLPPEREVVYKREQTLPGVTLLDFVNYENKWDPEE